MSLIHIDIPIPVRLWEEEKAASTLHLNRHGAGFCQPTGCVLGVLPRC